MYTTTVEEHIAALNEHSLTTKAHNVDCMECGRTIVAGTPHYEDLAPACCVDCGHRGAIYILDTFERVPVDYGQKGMYCAIAAWDPFVNGSL